MHLNITDSEVADNKGSSGDLVHYLDKEARTDKTLEPEPWFNSKGSGYQSYAVRNSIDKNVAKLARDESRFYLINISPSKKEIAHLKSLYGEQGAKDQFKAYAIKVMDEYARNFKRAGIGSNEDLLWFGKLENHRYYSHKDQEVKDGRAKRSECKPGDQMHIQVIVSRKDIRNKLKLSPENTSRGKNVEHSKKMGQFDRVAFKNSGERVFDESFDFVRPIADTFRYANTQVNGTLGERMAIGLEKRAENFALKGSGNQKDRVMYLPGQMVDHSLKVRETGSLLDILLAKADFDPAAPLKKKKKRRKGQQSAQELGM